MQTQERRFLLLLQNYFSEKKTKLFEREILTSRKVLYTKFCTHNQFLFFEKDALKNMDFSCLKCQQKKLTQHVCKDFSSFSRQGKG